MRLDGSGAFPGNLSQLFSIVHALDRLPSYVWSQTYFTQQPLDEQKASPTI